MDFMSIVATTTGAPSVGQRLSVIYESNIRNIVIITDETITVDSLHRLVKLAMDTGEAESVEEAEKLFMGYRLAVSVGDDVGESQTHQATLLTIVNCASRCLLGGIEVEGIAGMDLLVPIPPYRSLEEAVRGLGGHVVQSVCLESPLVVVGDALAKSQCSFAIRTTFEGWSAGIVPLSRESFPLRERHEFTPSGVLAGALAVAEAFQFLRGSYPMAGRREVGLSLWRIEKHWRNNTAHGPAIERLPAALWLVGLGNLGQAYLWTLGMLPYATPNEVNLVLQDCDFLTRSNNSTSLLTNCKLIGMRKTRAMSDWAEQRGFKATIIERRFDSDFRVRTDEPALALCGVDNAKARRVLEDVGFVKVIDAGLGGGTHDFLGFRTHVFPGVRRAREVWNQVNVNSDVQIDLPAYKQLAAFGLDRCGLTQIAGRTVGAPFVGATAAAIVIAETLRTVNGAHSYDLIDGHLRDLKHLMPVLAENQQPFNPGTTASKYSSTTK